MCNQVYSVPRYLGGIKELFDAYTMAVTPGTDDADGASPVVRFCVSKQDEHDFCNEQLPLMNSAQGHVNFTCVLAKGKNCVAAVADGEADIMRTGSFDVYNGWVEHGTEVRCLNASRSPHHLQPLFCVCLTETYTNPSCVKTEDVPSPISLSFPAVAVLSLQLLISSPIHRCGSRQP